MIQARIQHWHNRYRADRPLPADLCRQWDASLADIDIDDVLADAAERDEWVLIRRLPVTARWRIEDGPVQVGAVWQQALTQSLRQMLEHGGPDVVRYRDRREAIADLVYRAALGDTARAWAWRRMGLISESSPTVSALLAAALRTILDEPAEIWPLFTRLLRADAATGAWTGLMRALSTAAWQELLLTAPQTRPFAVITTPAEAPVNSALPTLDTTGATALLAWVRSQPLLARRHTEVLTILLAALSRPVRAVDTLAQPVIPADIRAAARQILAELLPGQTPALRRDPSVLPDAAPSAHAETDVMAEPERQADRESGNSAADELPALPALPEAAEWRATEWAGLLFLLRLLPASGALDELPGAIAIPLFLWRLATRLNIPVTDPAVWAFCGDWQPGAAERNAAPETWADLDALADRVATDWSAWLAAQVPDLPEPRLATVCRRPGRIRFEPGWMELHLPLDAADVRLRRLALDLDPGWLPWLGCVVRICYD